MLNKLYATNQDRIAAMELNQAIAEKLLGWQPFYSEEVQQTCFRLPDGTVRNPFHVPEVSTDVGAFFAVVVPAMRAKEWGFDVHGNVHSRPLWEVGFTHVDGGRGVVAEADDLPLAGCRAALQALQEGATP